MTMTLPVATDEQVASYQKNGFVKFEQVLQPDEVAAFRQALAEATARPGEDRRDPPPSGGGGPDRGATPCPAWWTR